MPSFAHLIIGLGISLFLYKVTEGKFTTKHGLVFTINNLFGPDLASLLPTGHGFSIGGIELPELAFYYFFHGYGWFIVALPLTIIWDLMINVKPWKKDNERFMKTFQVYLLIAAGGLFHLFVDVIGHPSYINYLGEEFYPWGAVWIGWGRNGDPVYLSITDILATGMFPCGNKFGFIEAYIFYGICFLVFFLILLAYAHKSGDRMFRGFIILCIFYIVPLAFLYYIPDYYGVSGMETYNGVVVNYITVPGRNTHSSYIFTGGEADLGVLLYFFLLFAVPFLFLYYSIKDKLEPPISQKEEKPKDLQPIVEKSETS